MEILEIAKKEYPAADTSGRILLERIFGSRPFKTIMERVTTFEEACIEMGEDPQDPKFSSGPKDEWAYRKLKVIYAALNEGVKLSYADSSQKKWRLWWEWDASISGFRLDASVYDLVASTSTGGSRLCLVSEKIANHCGKYFAKEHNDFMIQFEK